MCREDQAVPDTPGNNGCHTNMSKTKIRDRHHPMRSSSTSKAYSLGDSPFLCLQLLQHVILSAWRGQRLTQATVIFMIHLVLHWQVLNTSTSGNMNIASWSCFFLRLNFALLFSGYVLLVALYRHSVQTVFNCKVPAQFMPSFTVHLSLMKPLQIIFRYITLRFRVLPDILVLGEVRCGTTTLCQHLASTNGCHAPFCLWQHPELDKKETFFFVGHYLGNVTPQNYRMCFPLGITRFFHRRILRRPFFTFEGCAQYLSSPTAPYLIAKAYKDAGQQPPVLVACVRDPVDQTVSWWNYENHAIAWGQSMGIIEWNTCIRTPDFPPETLSRALSYSSSDKVREMYDRAEELFQPIDGVTSFTLPKWAMTWPAGQLSGIGRNGAFVTNVQRYERVFRECFGDSANIPTIPITTELTFVNVVPLEVMRREDTLLSTLRSLLLQINVRTASSRPVKLNETYSKAGIHRNSTASLGSLTMTPTSADRAMLAAIFSDSTKELEILCQTKFGWQEVA